MDIFQYYVTNPITNKIDIFRQIDFSEFLDSDNYEIVEISQNDSLMRLSYIHYDTIDDWWIIYVFNKLYDTMFIAPTEQIINKTIEKYIYYIKNFNSITQKQQAIVSTLVREYYLIDNDLETAIKKTNLSIKNITDSFIVEITNYINETMVMESLIFSGIKIPKLDLVLDIKNFMEQKTIEWSQNG